MPKSHAARSPLLRPLEWLAYLAVATFMAGSLWLAIVLG